MRSPRIVSVFEKGDEKLKTACRGTGREIVSRRFLSKPSPRRRMGLLMRLCRGKFIGFAPDHILSLSLSFPRISRGKWKIGRLRIVPWACIEGRGTNVRHLWAKRDWISTRNKKDWPVMAIDRSIDRSPAFLSSPPLSNQPFSRTKRCQESLKLYG